MVVWGKEAVQVGAGRGRGHGCHIYPPGGFLQWVNWRQSGRSPAIGVQMASLGGRVPAEALFQLLVQLDF